jgi:ankyrin repeat protein
MPTLPAHPNLDQLRHQAKDLLRAASAGDEHALELVGRVSDRLTLSAAQTAVARDYGFSSWPKLKAEVEARTLDLAQKVEAFYQASVGGSYDRPARLLAATPEIAGYDITTALLLGDPARVREELERDPGLATRHNPQSGWTALHAVCSSRWHRSDPARAQGLLAVAQLLLDAGADATALTRGRRVWTPLCCAITSTSADGGNAPIIQLLLEHGATPEDRDLYLVAFADDGRRTLRLLLEHAPGIAEIARTALGGPIGAGDVEAVRLMLEAGADPRRFVSEGDGAHSAVYEAITAGGETEMVELLLSHGADPDAPGADGRSPYRLATAAGRRDLTDLLRRYGATEDATESEQLLSACMAGDRPEALKRLARDPGLLERLTEPELGAIVRAAETGNTEAVRTMLDLGFPIGVHGGEHGATALHAAAYSGSADTVRLLLERSADLEALDTRWQDTPLSWAAVGSGERPRDSPAPDWMATVRALLDAGASTEGLTLSPEDPKPPSPEVAALLREYGVGDEAPGDPR